MLLKKDISSTVLDLKFNSMTYRFSLWFWLRAGLSVSPPWNWAASFPLLERQVGYSAVAAGGPLAKVLFQPCLHWKPDVLSSPFDWRLSAFLEEKYQMSSSLSLRLKWKFSWGGGERERDLKCIIGDYLCGTSGSLGHSYTIWLWERACRSDKTVVGFRVETG